MKKFVFKTSILCLTLLFFSACGSTRKGCGLTSDANKIEASTSIEYETTIVAE